MGLSSCLVVLLCIALREVSAKYCWYSSQGYTKYFYCNSYEYCCGNSCCENFTQFYKLWYFWFCVVLSLLICSGGGYWYRKRYLQRRFLIGQPQTSAVVTMTQSSTTSADGTCTRIPTGTTSASGTLVRAIPGGGAGIVGPPQRLQEEEGIRLEPHSNSTSAAISRPSELLYASTTAMNNTLTTQQQQGMTYQAACGCPPSQADNSIYAPPPSYPPPAPASTPATHPRGTLLLSGVVRITQKGNVIYQTVPCGPPPSYDSILQLASEACNCCSQPNISERGVTGSDGDLPGDHHGGAGGSLVPGGAEGGGVGLGGPRMRRCVSNEYVQFCHMADGRQVVVGGQAAAAAGPHGAGNQCPVCEINRRRAQQQEDDTYVYSPVTPPPPEGEGMDREDDYNFRERPQIPKYDDGGGMDLIYNLPVDQAKVGIPGAVTSDNKSDGNKPTVPTEGCVEGNCTCECVQCQADCHGNCIYGTLDLKGCKSKGKSGAKSSAITQDGEGADSSSGGEEGERNKQILQLHQQLRKRHELHVMEHQKLMQDQHRAFQQQLAKASGHKYPRPQTDDGDTGEGNLPEEPEEEPLLPEPLKPTEYKRDIKWTHPLADISDGNDKEEWQATGKSASNEPEKTERTPLLQPVTEVTDPEIKQQLLQRQLLEHQWRLHQQTQQQEGGAKDANGNQATAEESLTLQRADGTNQLFTLQPLQPTQANEPIYSLSMKQQQKLIEEAKNEAAAWRIHNEQLQEHLQASVQPKVEPPKKEKKKSFWSLFTKSSSNTPDEKIMMEERQRRHPQQQELHQELLQHRLVYRDHPLMRQASNQQLAVQPKLSGQLPPQKQAMYAVTTQNLQHLQEQFLQQHLKQQAQQQQIQQQQEQQLQSLLVPQPAEEQQPQAQSDGTNANTDQPKNAAPAAANKTAQRVRFSFSDESDKKEDSEQQSLLTGLQEQVPKNETPVEKVERQRKHHQKILQKQAELLEKYKREWFSKKKKEGK